MVSDSWLSVQEFRGVQGISNDGILITAVLSNKMVHRHRDESSTGQVNTVASWTRIDDRVQSVLETSTPWMIHSPFTVKTCENYNPPHSHSTSRPTNIREISIKANTDNRHVGQGSISCSLSHVAEVLWAAK